MATKSNQWGERRRQPELVVNDLVRFGVDQVAASDEASLVQLQAAVDLIQKVGRRLDLADR